MLEFIKSRYAVPSILTVTNGVLLLNSIGIVILLSEISMQSVDMINPIKTMLIIYI
jgi:hypothetical protein